MSYGLDENVIQQIKSVLGNFPEVEEVIIYGSRAKGNYKNGSDIDLTLKGKNVDLLILGKIDDHLDDLLLPYKFDLSIYNQINSPELLEHIDRVGDLFFSRNSKTIFFSKQ